MATMKTTSTYLTFAWPPGDMDSSSLAGLCEPSFADAERIAGVVVLEASSASTLACTVELEACVTPLMAGIAELTFIGDEAVAHDAILAVFANEAFASDVMLDEPEVSLLAGDVTLTYIADARVAGDATLAYMVTDSLSSTAMLEATAQPRLACGTTLTTVIVSSGLIINLDAGNTLSYPGTGTTWTDLAAPQHNGTLVNSPTYTTDDGGAFTFVRSSAQYVNNPIPFSYTSGTIQVWCRPASFTALQNINTVSDANGPLTTWAFNLMIDTTGKLQSYGPDVSGSTSMRVNTWHLCTFTWASGQTARLYLDGSEVPDGSVALYSVYTNGTRIIWATQSGGGKAYFDGRIGQALFYDRALSGSEIKANFDATKLRFGVDTSTTRFAQSALLNAVGTPRFAGLTTLPYVGLARLACTSGTLQYKNFNLYLDAGTRANLNENVTTWTDLSGNGRDATLVGATWNPVIGSVSYPGSSQSMSAPGPLIGTTNGVANNGMTVEMWVKPVVLKDYAPNFPIAGWGTFVWHATASGGIYIGTDINYRIYINSQFTAGNVYCITYTWNGGYGSGISRGVYYRNGVQVTASAYPAMPSSLSSPMWISSDSTCEIYIIRTYSRCLTADQVAANYNELLPRFQLGTWTTARAAQKSTFEATITPRMAGKAELHYTATPRLAHNCTLEVTLTPRMASKASFDWYESFAGKASFDWYESLAGTASGTYMRESRTASTSSIYKLNDANTTNLWRFDSGPQLIDEGSGGFGTTGMSVYNGPASVGTGHLGNCWNMNNATYGVVDVQNGTAASNTFKSTMQSGNFTVEGWVYIPSTATYSGPEWMMVFGAISPTSYRCLTNAIFQSGSDWYLVWLMYTNGDTQIGTSTFPSNTWTHYAYRRQYVGGQYSHNVCLNGVQVGATQNIATPYFQLNYPTYWIIGYQGGFFGKMDTLRISNKYRTDQEIWDFYYNT